MIYLIGLGLSENDISLGAVDVLKKCDDIYCEFYTARWNGQIENIENIINKKIRLLQREEVESDFLINNAKKRNSAV